MYINFIVAFIVIIVTNITLYNIFKYNGSKFGVTDIKICANLEDHFFQYALLIWKNLNVLLACPMLQMKLPSIFKRH